MSILDQPIEKPANDFPQESEFMKEFLQPKQETNVAEVPNIEEPGEQELPDSPEVPEEQKKVTRRAARQTSKLLVSVIDSPLSAVLSHYAKSENIDKYGATADERDTLEEAFTNYLETKGADIPPGIMLLIVVLTIYGSKFAQAFSDRKANKRAEEAEARSKQLESENAALREQLNQKEDERNDKRN